MVLSSAGGRALWQKCKRPPRSLSNIDPDLKRDLHPGWLMPYIRAIDNVMWGRWAYWQKLQLIPPGTLFRWRYEGLIGANDGSDPPDHVIEAILPDEPIPPIDLGIVPDPETRRMLRICLDSIPGSGGYAGLDSRRYIEFFLNWFLYSVGHPAYPSLPPEDSMTRGASIRLYQLFDVSHAIANPADYLGPLIAESRSRSSNQRQGFFPSPIPIGQLIAGILNGGSPDSKRTRLELHGEPACGTGALLLAASNNSLRAVGQDIDRLLLEAALVQCYLYAPWYAIPLWWYPGSDLLLGDSLDPSVAPESMNARYWFGKSVELVPVWTVENPIPEPSPPPAPPPMIARQLSLFDDF